MFAEELGSNASRRRQEENRARRRKLKEEQQKKTQQQQQQQQEETDSKVQKTIPISSSSAAAAATNTVDPPVKTTMSKTIQEVLPGSVATSTASSKELSAVEIADIQRRQRHVVQTQKNAATTIQAFYRAHQSNMKLLLEQTELLTKRLQDLSMLQVLLKRQQWSSSNNNNNSTYVPPPATATALALQLLFLTKSIPYRKQKNENPSVTTSTGIVKLRNMARDSVLVQQFLDLVLIPGVNSTDENVNPIMTWAQSNEGILRIKAILRLALVVATYHNNSTAPFVDGTVIGTCLTFIKAVTTGPEQSNDNVNHNNSSIVSQMVQTCRPLLVLSVIESSATNGNVSSPRAAITLTTLVREQNTSGTSLPTKMIKRVISLPYYASRNSQMDLISILRYHLLYVTGGAPIPSTSDKAREACIPPKERQQASLLFQSVFSIISSHMDDQPSHQRLMVRFVSEILTVPLLTWKVSDSCLDLLLVCNRHNRTRRSQPMLVSIMELFSEAHGDAMSMGNIESTLCQDISLNRCNATPTQILLANMIQLGRSSVQLNASQPNKLDFEAAIVYFRFLATLVDAVPVSTFSSRESVVEWISDGKGHHSPVVLSPIVLEQCRLLVSDTWARRLFQSAMDSDHLQTEKILSKKTDKDLKMEKELAEVAATSTAALAAKEARTDRSKAFWKSSVWAKKLSKGVGSILTNKGNNNIEEEKRQTSGLINATAMSRKFAAEGSSTIGTVTVASSLSGKPESPREHSVNPHLLGTLCVVYGIVLSRWGGGGGEDIVALKRPGKKGSNNEVATTTPDPCTQNLLSVLCFSTSFIRVAWAEIQSEKFQMPTETTAELRSLSIRPTVDHSYNNSSTTAEGYAMFYLFVAALSHILILTDDAEIHDLGRPIPIHQLRRVVIALKQLLYKASCTDERNNWSQGTQQKAASRDEPNYFGLSLIQSSSKAMRDLYDRSSRRPICVPKLWTIDDLMEKELRRCKTKEDYVLLLNAPVLRVCPFLVSFKRRLRLFERIIYTDRVQMQGENNANPFNPNPLKPGFPVRITRGRVLEDGLATMNNLGSDMRQRIVIHYYNQAGARETGIDAGGLFKEFWTDLSAIAFDLNFALFCINDQNCMYPNPSSGAAHGSDHIRLFEFLGRILGKSLYENITIQPQFAHFFLSFLRGDYNYLHMFSDLGTMDSQLYDNLMFLKTYDGNAEDLCLTFTVTVDDFGGTKEIPLIPNGTNVEVTNSNKHRYIGLVTKYYVVDRVKEQSEAFTRGLWEVIDKTWLRIFNEPELQVLISGSSDGKIDVEDLRAHSRYAGGFTGIDRTVNRFWNVLASMNSKQQADLLRFVTSCERPPPLGFATLSPPFTIQRVGILRDGDKLPSASTCFNTLKLPTYSSEKVMKERLLYAIESGAGFELT